MALPALGHLPTHDELGRPRFDWDEPLILDVIQTIYGSTAEEDGARDAARLHLRFLRALFDGETARSGSLRIELIACCAGRRISSEIIAAADHAAFSELNAIIQSRFRNSPRVHLFFIARLHEALGTLTSRKTPARRTPPRERIATPSRQPVFAFSG